MSYRAAPPRANRGAGPARRAGPFRGPWGPPVSRSVACPARTAGGVCETRGCDGRTWRRPTLPRLETKYHRRWSVSRPGSEWDRVRPLRHGHQVGPSQRCARSWSRPAPAPWEGARALATRTIKPIGRLVPVSFVRCRTSTPGLSTWSSSTALIGTTRFQVGFPLRCLQRLSRPHIATLLCRWRDNRSTSGASTPVLSY